MSQLNILAAAKTDWPHIFKCRPHFIDNHKYFSLKNLIFQQVIVGSANLLIILLTIHRTGFQQKNLQFFSFPIFTVH